MTRRAIVACLGLLAAASPSSAQDTTRWGVAGTFIPRWEFLEFLEDPMDRSIDMRGDDLRVGVIRGRQRGGDWGVSFVRRRIADDSFLRQEQAKCVARPGQPDVCAAGTMHRTEGASLTGVQAHGYFPLATIAGRVQLGLVVSGGVARVRGQAEEIQEHLRVQFDDRTGALSLTVAEERQLIEAREIFDHTFVAEYLPIGGAEAAVAVLLGPDVKLRFSGGVAFPGYHTFSVTVQYLFGR